MANKDYLSKLYRSNDDKTIAGVCGGLGEHFGIDPTILRVAFVLITIFGGSGVIIYLVLWLVIPAKSSLGKNSEEYIKENAEDIKVKSEKLAKKGYGRILGGVILVVLGLTFLSENLGFYAFHNIWKFWPVALIAIGLSVLSEKTKK